MLSNELQIGKAGEHFACADLIMQGYNAFLADQGLPFDIVVDTKKGLKRVQVKSVRKKFSNKTTKDVYRFGLRKGRIGGSISPNDIDYVAFVALDAHKIAYIPVNELVSTQKKAGGFRGSVKKAALIQMIELRDKDVKYKGRVYSNGTVRGRFGRFIDDYSTFTT